MAEPTICGIEMNSQDPGTIIYSTLCPWENEHLSLSFPFIVPVNGLPTSDRVYLLFYCDIAVAAVANRAQSVAKSSWRSHVHSYGSPSTDNSCES